MVTERASTCKSSETDTCSSSSYSSQTSSSSLSSTTSSSSSSSSGTHTRLRDHKHHRSKLQATKIRKTSKRESRKKHHKDEHAHGKRRRSSKKKRKHNLNTEAYGRSDRKKRMKSSKNLKQEKSPEDEYGRLHSDKKRKRKHQSEGDSKEKEKTNIVLEAAMNAQEQQKAMIRRNAEIAKARLESGELQRAREAQSKMYQLYGTVDWRAKKKLRTEKKKLEKTVAAGKKLASLEEREYARMDAFRVALGLPTAEAQRQAEWRAEATQALFELESGQKQAINNRSKRSKLGRIGPSLPPN